jgi:hypothetical protein
MRRQPGFAFEARAINLYQVIIDMKADDRFLIRGYRRFGLLLKKMIVQGQDKMFSRPLEYPSE